jgi:hypothetical protein
VLFRTYLTILLDYLLIIKTSNQNLTQRGYEMSKRVTLIGTFGFIAFGFSLFCAPVFAAPAIVSDVASANSSSMTFIVLAFTGFFGFALELL